MFLIMLSLTISLIIVIFALQNSSLVPVIFFNWSSEIPLVVIIFASVFAGAAIIFFLALWKDVKQKFTSVSSKATEYKGVMSSKKEALSARLERRKPSAGSTIPDNLSNNHPTTIEHPAQAEPESPVSIPGDPLCTKESKDK